MNIISIERGNEYKEYFNINEEVIDAIDTILMSLLSNDDKASCNEGLRTIAE